MLLTLGSFGAVGETLTYRFDIPEQSADKALTLLAQQAKVPLLFSFEEVQDVITAALAGEYTLEAALTQLMAGTNLKGEVNSHGVLTVTTQARVAPVDKETKMLSGNEIISTGKKRGLLGFFAAFFSLGISAQEPMTADEAMEQAKVVEEIIVTAQRREQSMTKVGITLNVLDKDSIERQGINELGKIASLVPGLDIFRGNGSNNPTLTLRGVGTTNPWLNNNQSVASYVDGTYLPFGSYLTFPLFDMERIETLKGPQIALYGRNATAGVVNFISAAPTDELDGYADFSYGSYDAVDAKAAVSGSVGDNLQLRIAGIVMQGGGYMYRPGTGPLTGFSRVPNVIPGIAAAPEEDGYGDKDVYAFRATATWQSSSKFEGFLSFHYGQDKSELIGSTNTNGDRLGVFSPPNNDAFVDYDNVRPRTDTEQYGGVIRLNWLLGDYTFSSITGFEQMDRVYSIGDFVPTRIAEASFDENVDTFNQEFTLSFDRGEQLQWFAGASITGDDIDYLRDLVSYDLLLGSLRTSFVEEDDSWAVFGQGEMTLNDQWLLTLGLRYTDEEKTYNGGSIALDPFGRSVVGAVFPNTAGDGLFARSDYSESNLSGKVALNWTPKDDLLVFSSISNGFKSGGFDGSGITEPSSFTPFNSESVWAYELGTKATLHSGQFFVAASFFYNDYQDKQVIALVDLGGGLAEAIIQNAAKSEIYGLDFETKWLFSEGLALSFNGTWLESEVTDWASADPDEIAAHVGNEIPGTPGLSLTGKIDWSKPLQGGFTLNMALWASYADSAFRDIANSADLESDGYTVVSARVDLVTSGGYSFYLSGENLFDDEFVTSVRSLIGMLGEYHGAPRTFKFGVRYAF